MKARVTDAIEAAQTRLKALSAALQKHEAAVRAVDQMETELGWMSEPGSSFTDEERRAKETQLREAHAAMMAVCAAGPPRAVAKGGGQRQRERPRDDTPAEVGRAGRQAGRQAAWQGRVLPSSRWHPTKPLHT